MANITRYSEEYKIEAVKMYEELGFATTAKQLQIPVNTLRNWVYKKEKKKVIKPEVKCESEEDYIEEIKSLKSELEKLKNLYFDLLLS